ncbi:phospholipid-transporting ATPase ABCA1 isoform X1 [Stigmatopora argus]
MYVLWSGLGSFCQNLIDILEGTPGLRYLWTTFKLFFRGKVLFTPDTPATRLIVKEANGTFDALATLKGLADSFERLGPRLWDFFQNDQRVDDVRTLLADPLFAGALDRHLDGSGWSAALLANFLYNGPPEERPAGMPPRDWRDVHNSTALVLRLLSDFLGCLDLNKFEGVPSETQLVSRSLDLLKNDTFWAGVAFADLPPDADRPPAYVRYKIRMDVEEVEPTDKTKERSWSPGARDNSFNDLRYIRGGFAYLQDMIDHGIVRTQTSGTPPFGVFAQQMPYPCYVDDAFLRALVRLLPLYMTLAWIYSVATIVKSIVGEKEARLTETIRIAGLRGAAYWLSWAVSSALPLAFSSLLLALILKYGKVLQYSDPTVIFVFLLVFCLATVAQCFFISVFFSKANIAAACGGLIYFVLYLPHLLCYAWRDVLSFGAKVAASLLSCVAFGFGCESFSKYEEQGVGIQWSNAGRSPVEGERYTFAVSIGVMLFDAALYWTLAWYVENVFPGEYGIPRPWYFPLTASYWRGSASKVDEGSLKDAATSCDEYAEDVEPGLKAGVSLRKLVKVYKSGKKAAVDGLSVDFYENHITSFLGHNGAGKTTTMSILCGLFPPTSGTAFINGYDIRTHVDAARRHLGMCPQHNVLFNELTVEEHIYFYGRLKGLGGAEANAETERMIRDVGLPHKRRDLAKNLSGGMQRKLSVAMAFVGGSKVVILDEPTAGVDPYARRGIWELLLKYKQGRTIILCTHHMDEADILGDRIAMVAHGRLRCCGSSLFLKKRFGRGYYLTLVQEQERPSKANESAPFGSQTHDGVHPSALSELVRRHVPGAQFLERVGQEVTYVLPYDGATDGSFASLFGELDEAQADLGLSGYGVSDTTLEEIFLKMARAAADDWTAERKGVSAAVHPEAEREKSGESDDVEMFATPTEGFREDGLGGSGPALIGGRRLIWRQFLALFVKRFHHARRSRKGLLAQMVLPAVFVCLSLIFSLIVPPFSEYPSLELQPWMYGLPQTTFFSNDASGDANVSAVAESLANDPGFGTRCMDGEPIPGLPCVHRLSDWFTPSVDQSVADILAEGNWSFSNPSPPCRCSTPRRQIMLPDCPPAAGGLPPPQRIQNTTDTLLDVTGRNMSDFLVKTFEKSGKTRYGGISVGAVDDRVGLSQEAVEAAFGHLRDAFNVTTADPTEEVLAAAEVFLKKMTTKRHLKVWFYNRAWHGLTSFLNVAANAILRAGLPAGEDPRRYGISVSSHPLNLTKMQLSMAALAASSTDVVVSICVIFAMSFIPASFVLFLIQERVSKAKHLQLVSGVNPTVYWLANFAWDTCNYAVPCVAVVLIFLCFGQEAYVSAANLPALSLLLLLYGWSITPTMYPASFVFGVPSTAYVALTCINLFIGINASVATFVMELLDDDSVTYVNDIVKQVLLVFPHFCLGRGLIDMAKNQAMANLFSNFGEDRFKDPLSWEMTGRNLLAMALQGALMFAVTLLIQYNFFCKRRLISAISSSAEEEDVDVARERERVYAGKARDDLLRLHDLTKAYPGKRTPAVDRLCVGVPAAECFGLLGINGAGKTTTFKMLTGDVPLSAGEAFLDGFSVRTQLREAHRRMGYCPQFDAIDALLTGREHLELYARLRGVPETHLATVTERGIRKLGLVKYASKPAGTYSGGNKRKLSTAIALTGCPRVVFLDEPTTGMDPEARRFLWDCVLSMVKEGRSVILTSHSMEECEALCTRMAIMVDGRFKCLGSIQHLKSRFGEGYTVTIRVGGRPPDLNPVRDFVGKTFPGSILKEEHHNTLRYQLPAGKGALARIFQRLAEKRRQLGVEDYSVAQTTLDQVFVNFASRQQGEDDSRCYDNPVDLSDEQTSCRV